MWERFRRGGGWGLVLTWTSTGAEQSSADKKKKQNDPEMAPPQTKPILVYVSTVSSPRKYFRFSTRPNGAYYIIRNAGIK